MSPPSPPATAAPGRLWSLDAFRGLCALLVFLSHWHIWSNFAPQGGVERFLRYFGENAYDAFIVLIWPTGGHHPAVICFFVLSGFCIHYPFAVRARAGAAPDWSAYYRRRVGRIFPVYWLATLGGLAFVATQTLHPAPSPLLQFHASYTPAGVAARLAGLEGLYPREIIAGNYILTTVASEIVMYAFYPLLYAFAARRGWAQLGALCAGLHLFSLGLLALGVTPFWVFNSFFMLGLFWYAGALAAHLFVAGRAHVRLRWLLAAWSAFLAAKALPHFTGMNLIKQALWGLVCTLAILVVLELEQRHARWRAWRSMRSLVYLGQISYSLYAVHTPAVMFASWCLLQWARPDYLAQLGATLLFSAAATLAVHYGVERRFRHRRPNEGAGAHAPAPAHTH